MKKTLPSSSLHTPTLHAPTLHTPSKDALSSTLRVAVEALYAVFGYHRAPRYLLDVCTHCCMDPALEAEMRRLPLRELSAKHFYEYNSSAKSVVQPADEMLYLLPRLLELVAEGAEVHHSTELSMQRMGSCEPGAFSVRERAALDAFALALFSERLAVSPWVQDGRAVWSNAFDLLVMFELGGIALEPLLAHWLTSTGEATTLNYAYSVYWNFWETQSIRNAFANDRLAFQAAIYAWMMNPGNRACFAEKLLAVNTAALTENEAQYCSPVTPNEVVGAVFDFAAG